MRAEIRRSAHFEHDRRKQALIFVDGGTGERQAFHHQSRTVGARRQSLEILQAIELAGHEGARREGRVDSDFDDGRRQPFNRAHGGAQPFVHRRGKSLGRHARMRDRAHLPADDGIAQFRARHRLHDIAGETRMQIAEKLTARPSGRALIST